MSIAEKLSTIAENEQKVYDAGYSQAKQDNAQFIRDLYTDNDTRTDYQYAFSRSRLAKSIEVIDGKDVITPYVFETPIAPPANATINYMFSHYGHPDNDNRKFPLPRGIDLSNVSPNATVSSLFSYCYTDTIYDMGLPAMKNQLGFGYSTAKTIELIRMPTDVETISPAFSSCYNLENVTFEGTLWRTINISFSPLTLESAKSIILALKDYSGTDKANEFKVQFSGTVKTNLQNDLTSPSGGNWYNYILEKGWTC